MAPPLILVPVDFSPASAGVVDYAARLGRQLGMGLELLHVWEPPALAATDFLTGSPGWTTLSLEALAREQADEQLAALARRVAERGSPVHWRAEVGHVSDRIAERAREVGAELIVMGTHGRTGPARVLLGSVAQRVSALAPCPVLTCRLDLVQPAAVEAA